MDSKFDTALDKPQARTSRYGHCWTSMNSSTTPMQVFRGSFRGSGRGRRSWRGRGRGEGERERRVSDIRSRALCPPRAHTLGYSGGCDCRRRADRMALVQHCWTSTNSSTTPRLVFRPPQNLAQAVRPRADMKSGVINVLHAC